MVTTAMIVGPGLLALALWVVMPDPHHRLHRLEPVHSGARGAMSRVVRGKEGAASLPARLLAGLGAGLLSFILLPEAGGIVALVGLPLLAVVGGGQLTLRRGEAAAAREDLADTVELLAVCLAAGAPIRYALEVVADTRGVATTAVLEKVLGLLAVGIPEQQAWLELADDEVWGPVARDVARSARSGTSLVAVLHVHAEEARLLAQEGALKRARTAGVRSVIPLMVCFLPAFVLVGVVPIIAGLLDGLLSS